ncbi:MAG: creatininase family protein [Alphaproteobacteria bacterium]|nr:creatininase family protein [Alphaproteobacteria bacterium]
MQLQLSTWQEVEKYLETSTGIILPIGSTEQHGPNGLIGTDAICPEVIGREIGNRTGALVGPTISVGMAQHHLAFAGSMTLRPSTMIAMLSDYVTSLAKHGFRRFYFLNGHGGNIQPVNTAFSEIYANRSLGADMPQLRLKLRNWFDSEKVRAYSKEHFGDLEGMHATISEVSVTQYAYPDAIKDVGPMEKAGHAGRPFGDCDDYRTLYPDGRMGSKPDLATPEHGKALVEASVSDLVEDYKAFMAQA